LPAKIYLSEASDKFLGNLSRSASRKLFIMSKDPGSLKRELSLHHPVAHGGDDHDALISDGFGTPADLGAGTELPPAYGDALDQVQLSQAGFEAGAAVTSK